MKNKIALVALVCAFPSLMWAASRSSTSYNKAYNIVKDAVAEVAGMQRNVAKWMAKYEADEDAREQAIKLREKELSLQDRLETMEKQPQRAAALSKAASRDLESAKDSYMALEQWAKAQRK